MKANDTLMDKEALEKCYRDGLLGWWLRIAQTQSEISFKAGINEVVEWGKETCPHCIGMTYCYKRVCDTCWQAKLKEWGID
uniref:Uncharacterized protein n=1 Tax=viral metagenome TaxID=1070528 RepID=A0A6M3LEJ7_9ZZZZ